MCGTWVAVIIQGPLAGSYYADGCAFERRIAAPCASGESEPHAVTGWFLGKERGMVEALRLARMSTPPPRGESPHENTRDERRGSLARPQPNLCSSANRVLGWCGVTCVNPTQVSQHFGDRIRPARLLGGPSSPRQATVRWRGPQAVRTDSRSAQYARAFASFWTVIRPRNMRPPSGAAYWGGGRMQEGRISLHGLPAPSSEPNGPEMPPLACHSLEET